MSGLGAYGLAAVRDGPINVLYNGLQPVDVTKLPQVLGVAEYVAAEVFVSYMARWLFKTEKRTLAELATIHAVSVPFIGGLSAFAEPNSVAGYEAGFPDLVMDGAKGVPGVFAAQYVINTALKGIHAPRLNFTDILVTAAAKIATRPLVSFIYQPMGETLRANLDMTEALFINQHRTSRLSKTGGGV